VKSKYESVRLVRCLPVLFAVVLFFGWTAGAYADNLAWTITGANESGSGSMTAINEGGGVYFVTNITGTLMVAGSMDTITGLVSPPATAGATAIVNFPGYTDTYDDLVYLGAASPLDINGLEFTVSGLVNAVNLCGGAAAYCNSTGSGVWFDDLGANIGDGITFSVVATPEPSTLVLAVISLLLLVFARRRLQSGQAL
jgi:hypothetical protein